MLLILALYNCTMPFVSICKKLGSTVPFSMQVYRIRVPVTGFMGLMEL